MEIGNLIPHIESLIFASEKPLTTIELTDLINQAFGFMEDKIVLDQVESAIQGIIEKYSTEYFPFEVRESGGGWQFLTKKDYHKTVAQLNGDKFLKRLSTAALETLSIIAYRQPVTKAEIEAIRGVSSDYAIQKLLEKELVAIIGRNESMPGHPLIYATSKSFMDYFGINSTDDLPKLKDVIDENSINPSIVNEDGEATHEDAPATFEHNTEDTSFKLQVDEKGQLIEVIDEESGEDIDENILNEPQEYSIEDIETDNNEVDPDISNEPDDDSNENIEDNSIESSEEATYDKENHIENEDLFNDEDNEDDFDNDNIDEEENDEKI